jgi:hypothetical protein
MKRNILILTSIAIFLLASMGCSAEQTADNTEVSIAAKQQIEPTAATVAPDTPEADVTQAETVKKENSATDRDEEIVRPEGWGEETHSKQTEPNYDVVFPQDKVNQITITIDPESWEAMQAKMVELYGESGRGQQGPGRGFPEDGERPLPPVSENGEMPEGFPMPGEGQLPPQGERPEGGGPGGPGFGGGGSFGRDNPMWVTATLEFEGNTWTNVGIRYKGNSSLMSSWNSGSSKLPLKLDFDEFYERYLNYLAEAGNLLDPEALTTKYQTLAELIRPYVNNPDTFDTAVLSLAERTAERNQAVVEFLANQ